jgi:hypothetical protein
VPQRPDGKPASVERVTFTRPAADRIARVVRDVELGGRDSEGFGLGVRLQGFRSAKTFRICTFTGSWDIGSSKTVTFRNQTNTISAVNLFWPVPDGEERDCAIGKDGTAWYLIVPRMYAADAATAASITTAAIEFKTLPVAALASSGTNVFTLEIADCGTATASP